MAGRRRTRRRRPTLSERVDGLVGIFSPAAAARRIAARAAANYMARFSGGYRGADTSRTRSAWLPGGGSADDELLNNLPRLRDRSRERNRNDGIASGITNTLVNNEVGTGIRPQSHLDAEALGMDEDDARQLATLFEKTFSHWAAFADAGRRMSFWGMQSLASRQMHESGEAFVMPVYLENTNSPYTLHLSMIEADRIDTPNQKHGDKSIRSGIKIGTHGDATHYYVRNTHPGDVRSYSTRNYNQYQEIPAYTPLGDSNMMHLYHLLRAGQTRGMPSFAPVLALFKDIGDVFEAAVITARVEACFSLIIKATDPFTSATNAAASTNSNSQRIEEIEPGMVKYLQPGEEVTGIDPKRPGNTFEPFVERILRIIGAALGLPYELVAKDFSKTNYSSARAALLQAYRYFRERQQYLSQHFCQPVYEMVLTEAYLNGEFPGVKDFMRRKHEYTRALWVPQGWQWVDPLKEVKASVLAIKNNLSTLAEENAAHGKNWDEIMEQRSREEKRREELELPDNLNDEAASEPSELTEDIEDIVTTAIEGQTA